MPFSAFVFPLVICQTVCHKHKTFIFLSESVRMRSLLLHLSLARNSIIFFLFRSFVPFFRFVPKSSTLKTVYAAHDTQLNDNFVWGFQFSQHNKWSLHAMGKYHWILVFVQHKWHPFYHNFSWALSHPPSIHFPLYALSTSDDNVAFGCSNIIYFC